MLIQKKNTQKPAPTPTVLPQYPRGTAAALGLDNQLEPFYDLPQAEATYTIWR
jgi:hypothetical protein